MKRLLTCAALAAVVMLSGGPLRADGACGTSAREVCDVINNQTVCHCERVRFYEVYNVSATPTWAWAPTCPAGSHAVPTIGGSGVNGFRCEPIIGYSPTFAAVVGGGTTQGGTTTTTTPPVAQPPAPAPTPKPPTKDTCNLSPTPPAPPSIPQPGSPILAVLDPFGVYPLESSRRAVLNMLRRMGYGGTTFSPAPTTTAYQSNGATVQVPVQTADQATLNASIARQKAALVDARARGYVYENADVATFTSDESWIGRTAAPGFRMVGGVLMAAAGYEIADNLVPSLMGHGGVGEAADMQWMIDHDPELYRMWRKEHCPAGDIH